MLLRLDSGRKWAAGGGGKQQRSFCPSGRREGKKLTAVRHVGEGRRKMEDGETDVPLFKPFSSAATEAYNSKQAGAAGHCYQEANAQQSSSKDGQAAALQVFHSFVPNVGVAPSNSDQQ